MGEKELLQEAATAVLDRGVEHASETAVAVRKQLQSARVREREFIRIYHDFKKLAILVRMILAVAVQLGAFLFESKLTLGGTRKKAVFFRPTDKCVLRGPSDRL